MTSNRFFIQKAKLQQSPVLLTGKEHHHLHSVVRIRSGDRVWLFDESGTEYLARVEFTLRDKTQLEVMEQRLQKEPQVKVILAQSLIKTSRLEFLLQKSTELGLGRFIPVISNRSIVKIEGKIEKKLERWSRIVREAAKQSGNTRVPVISPPKTLKELLKEDEEGLKIFLNIQGGTYLKKILLEPEDTGKRALDLPSSVRVLIGPEGGWTEEEEHDILKHGFKAMSLGPQTLRAETAAISCLVLINHFWNL